jgi:hypothetical protein
MEELARTVLASHLAAESGTSGSPPSFCVFFKTRNNNQVGRDDVVKLMATGTLTDIIWLKRQYTVRFSFECTDREMVFSMGAGCGRCEERKRA